MRPFLSAVSVFTLAACTAQDLEFISDASMQAPADVAVAAAYAETAAVASMDDAADDPAIWVNAADPARSLVLGTDKQAGLYVYDLAGAVVQFLPSGELNNVDLRQDVSLPGLAGHLAAATNRTDETVVFYQIDPASGAAAELARLPVNTTEPYGFCLGWDGVAAHAYVTYKDGLVQDWVITGFTNGAANAAQGPGWKLATQLEGCAPDEAAGVIYIGEEGGGLWRAPIGGGEPLLLDSPGSATGLTADVEGIDIYEGANGGGYVVVSSQGSSTFHLYDRRFEGEAANAFVGRFAVDFGGDKVTGTDGLDVISSPLGADLPEGLLIVQDDVNSSPNEPQNFKLVDWREVRSALGL
jgi:3-phytase